MLDREKDIVVLRMLVDALWTIGMSAATQSRRQELVHAALKAAYAAQADTSFQPELDDE